MSRKKTDRLGLPNVTRHDVDIAYDVALSDAEGWVARAGYEELVLEQHRLDARSSVVEDAISKRLNEAKNRQPLVEP